MSISATVIQRVQERADSGNVKDQLLLGAMYEEGHGVLKNFSEAYSWYQRAALQGDKKAQLRAGRICLLGGNGIERSIEKAAWFFKQSGKSNEILKALKDGLSDADLFELSIRMNDVETIQALLQKGFFSFEQYQHLGVQMNAICLAMAVESIEIACLLVPYMSSFDLTQKNESGNCALNIAMMKNYPILFTSMLSRVSNDDLQFNENHGLFLTLLYSAISSGQEEFALQLLAKMGPNESLAPSSGFGVPIFQQAMERCSEEFCLQLIDRMHPSDFSQNQCGSYENERFQLTPLHLALLKKRPRLVQKLMESPHADLETVLKIRDTSNKTPLYTAIEIGMDKEAQFMVQNSGVDLLAIPVGDEFPFFQAVTEGHEELAAVMFDRICDSIDLENANWREILEQYFLPKDQGQARMGLLLLERDLARAEEQGVVLAAANLGNAQAQYRQATKAKKNGNSEAAIDWFMKAAVGGDVSAQIAISEAYETGDQGVPRDIGKAIAWRESVAQYDQQPLRQSMLRILNYLALADLYLIQTDDIQPNKERAIFYLKKAEKLKSTEATDRLKDMGFFS